jgi:RNA polymerase sigma-70 factor (ECF subfamily)
MGNDPRNRPRTSAEAAAEADLVRRMAAGDERAVGVLFDRYAAKLLALAQRILDSPAEAEEVLQEAFLQAWHRAAGYDPARASVGTWLVLITRSRAIDRLRSRRIAERSADAARHEDPVAHESPRAVRLVLDEERRRRVETALAALPGEQREVLDLAYYQGLTQSEIAVATGTPLGTVKTRTLLAMKKLREALHDEIHELIG